MSPPAYLDEGGNIQSGCDISRSVIQSTLMHGRLSAATYSSFDASAAPNTLNGLTRISLLFIIYLVF